MRRKKFTWTTCFTASDKSQSKWFIRQHLVCGNLPLYVQNLLSTKSAQVWRIINEQGCSESLKRKFDLLSFLQATFLQAAINQMAVEAMEKDIKTKLKQMLHMTLFLQIFWQFAWFWHEIITHDHYFLYFLVTLRSLSVLQCTKTGYNSSKDVFISSSGFSSFNMSVSGSAAVFTSVSSYNWLLILFHRQWAMDPFFLNSREVTGSAFKEIMSPGWHAIKVFFFWFHKEMCHFFCVSENECNYLPNAKSLTCW